MHTFGFIGAGNMGGAVASALCKSVDARQVYLTSKSGARAAALAQTLGCHVTDNRQAALCCDYLFLGVKPQDMQAVLEDLQPVWAQRETMPVLISMAAGISLSQIEQWLGKKSAVVRIMPNTPVAVGQGVVLMCANAEVSKEQQEELVQALRFAGTVDCLKESLVDAAGALSGCGPAFVYLFTEALADGGVECGLPRDKAQLYAAQTVLGAAEMVLKSGKHPGALKDAVCSPGGTTIAGVHALENGAFRGTAMSAVKAAYDKTRHIGK